MATVSLIYSISMALISEHGYLMEMVLSMLRLRFRILFVGSRIYYFEYHAVLMLGLQGRRRFA